MCLLRFKVRNVKRVQSKADDYSPQGNQIQFIVFADSDIPLLSSMIDNIEIFQPDNSSFDQDKDKFQSFPVGASSVNASDSHTVVLHKAASASADSSWNFVGFRYVTNSV